MRQVERVAVAMAAEGEAARATREDIVVAGARADERGEVGATGAERVGRHAYDRGGCGLPVDGATREVHHERCARACGHAREVDRVTASGPGVHKGLAVRRSCDEG